MEKITINEAYSLGVLYTYIYSEGRTTKVSIDSLDKYYNVVKSNINRIDCYAVKREHYGRIYDIVKDENQIDYCVLKSDVDLTAANIEYVGSLPLHIFLASQMDNALEVLGFIRINGKLRVKEEVMKRKLDGECCANCEFVISDEMLENIRKENSDYSNLSYEELREIVGYCEFKLDNDIIYKLGYWCPNYLRNLNANDDNVLRRKMD